MFTVLVHFFSWQCLSIRVNINGAGLFVNLRKVFLSVSKEEKLVEAGNKIGLLWKQRFFVYITVILKHFLATSYDCFSGQQLWWGHRLIEPMNWNESDLKEQRHIYPTPLCIFLILQRTLQTIPWFFITKEVAHPKGEQIHRQVIFGSFSVPSEQSLWQRVGMELMRWWTCDRFLSWREVLWTFSLSEAQ